MSITSQSWQMQGPLQLVLHPQRPFMPDRRTTMLFGCCNSEPANPEVLQPTWGPPDAALPSFRGPEG